MNINIMNTIFKLASPVNSREPLLIYQLKILCLKIKHLPFKLDLGLYIYINTNILN